MASRIQRELALLLTGKDVSMSKSVRGVNSELGKLHSAGAKAGSAVGRNLERGIALGAAAATTAVGYAIKSAMDFESSSASVRKTVDGNVEAILRANRELAKTTGLEVNTLNEISAAAGALGVAKNDIDDFTKTVAILGVTTDDVSTDVASESIGHLSTTLKLAGADFEHFGNTLVHLGNHGASTEGQILSMTENIAGAADVMGASTPQVLGWASALANTGEEAEAGGSSIQRFWLESFKNVQKGGKDLRLMAKTTGMSAAAFKKAFGRNATGTLAKFITGLGKLSKAEQVATLEALGFKDIRIQRALLKLLANTDNLTDSLKNAETGWKDNKAATDEAAKRFETTASKLNILKANVEDAAITIGSELLPILADLSTDAVKWITEHQGDIGRFGKDLAAGIRDAVAWAKKIDWAAIGGGLKTAAEAGATLVEAFANAPPWLQGFLTTGFLANKFTGGAVMDIAGILLGQAVRGVLGMNAGIVNINAGVVRGGGGLPGTAGGGVAGAASKGLSGIAKVALVGEAIGLAALVGAVQQDVSQQSTEHAQDIHDTQKVYLEQSPTTEALKTSLAGVKQGIADLTSNPLLTLVQGDALTHLQQMDSELSAELARRNKDTMPDPRSFLPPPTAGANKDSLEGLRTAVNASTERLSGKLADDTAAVYASKAALESKLGGLTAAQRTGFSQAHAAIGRAAAQTTAGQQRTTSAVYADTTASRQAGQVAKAGGLAAAAAIRDKDLSVSITTNISTQVSIRDVLAKTARQRMQARYGID
jgi:TP901 family phage tail tape measure protein